jgi:hypothetical protein
VHCGHMDPKALMVLCNALPGMSDRYRSHTDCDASHEMSMPRFKLLHASGLGYGTPTQSCFEYA